MPINLKYGQQAVARGFITPQRLQQVLAKQRQLGQQGKKVSVRMILEKAKLLSGDQLAQIDSDLNIKVVKKKTGQIPKQQPPHSAPAATGAQDFSGGAVPQFSGMSGADPDATVFSPPPPDMQDRIREEREKAKDEARQRQEAEASAFFDDNDDSPFGADPFADQAMSPQAMEPQSMDPQPMDGGALQPEPFDQPEMQPMDAGFDDGAPSLERMDSSPKLESLAAEYDGFANPEDEALPTLDAGFNDFGGGHDPAPAGPPPVQPDLAPAGGGDGFNDFGNDIRSPEEMEAGPAPAPAAGPEPVNNWGDPGPKTASMDKTMFSPPPPGYGAGAEPQPEPEGDNWGEEAAAPVGMDDGGGDMDATVFSPPPPGYGGNEPAPAGPQATDDFAGVEVPQGKLEDDQPTAPATGDDDVHPMRKTRTSKPVVQSTRMEDDFGADVIDEALPEDEPAMADEGTGPGTGKLPGGPGKMPARKPLSSGKSLPKKEVSSEPVKADDEVKKKKKKSRLALWLVFLILIVLAVLILPVALKEQVPQLEPVRNNEYAKPIYDYVEKIYNEAQYATGMKERPKPPDGQVIIPAGNAPADNAPADNAPADNTPDDNTGDTGEEPASDG